MGKPLDTLTKQALELDPEDRVELAERLLSSVFPNAELDDAWEAEIEQRIEAIERGRTQLLSRAEVMSRVRAAINDRRAQRGS